ncbi:MAG: protein-tyrosine-phosphatase [Lachnospiraceae bacterium]|nr:protein-tyrosine-phosphatase [Lachnospiraceae bacterium]
MKYIDIHSHILPYMDDGARDAKMSLAMLRLAESEGISDIIVTPHYRKGHYKGERRQIDKVLAEIRDLMKAEGIQVNLYPGNEIYYHSELEEKLESGVLSTMNNTEYVLVEFSPMEDFMYIRSAIDQLFSIGYIPIIAHVERIQCIEKNIERARDLKKSGCDLQVNAASAMGETGFRCKRFVHKLLREELVDYIGTDAHDIDKRRPVIKKCAEMLYRKYNRDYVDEILFQNAATRLLASK